MIDPHVHLRDWGEAAKETVRHALGVARRTGLDAVFEMPNTVPPLTGRAVIERRLELADAACRETGGVMHGLYAGVTASVGQLREVVEAHRALFPRVVGLKLYAGHSTGGMGVVTEGEQRGVYRALGELRYEGVLAVHAEKESLLMKRPDGKAEWDPRLPVTHCAARPPEAELQSVADQIRFAEEEGFRGTLHIAHISVAGSLELVCSARARALPFRLSCGITPHHALLAEEDMAGEVGLLLKMNPPLRSRPTQRSMLQSLLAGKIDWIETDHAPHTLEDKTERHASGIPGLPFYPHFLLLLAANGLSRGEIEALTHRNIESVYGFSVPRGGAPPELDLASEYPYDPWMSFRVPRSGV